MEQMQIILGTLALAAMAFSLVLILALVDDAVGKRVAAVLLARVAARVAYRKEYNAVLGQREREFGLEELERWYKKVGKGGGGVHNVK